MTTDDLRLRRAAAEAWTNPTGTDQLPDMVKALRASLGAAEQRTVDLNAEMEDRWAQLQRMNAREQAASDKLRAAEQRAVEAEARLTLALQEGGATIQREAQFWLAYVNQLHIKQYGRELWLAAYLIAFDSQLSTATRGNREMAALVTAIHADLTAAGVGQPEADVRERVKLLVEQRDATLEATRGAHDENCERGASMQTCEPCNTTEIVVDGGKYIFRIDDSGGVHCLRYGEPWVIFNQGSKALIALVHAAISLAATPTPGEKGG